MTGDRRTAAERDATARSLGYESYQAMLWGGSPAPPARPMPDGDVDAVIDLLLGDDLAVAS